MKTFRHILLALAVVLTAASCGVSKVKDISITSMGISYIVPTSTRSMDAKLVIGIDNPARSFAVQEITGTVKYNDKPLAHFVTGTLELEGKSTQEYELPCTVTLDDGASLLDVLIIAAKRSLEGLTADIDVQAALKKNGVIRAPYKFRDLNLSQFAQ
ncbi:MAG: LEA type 2 family protein [Bacteroidales bacterium]|nr:LEA type 2 family protein [Bacteroidales bacterium]